MKNITYLDTSALNYLADNINDFDLFRYWCETLKIDVCISGVVIWEILLNSNDDRKDELIYWAQFNCSNYLLKSPSELFISYIENNCPKNDKKQFWYDRKTELDIGKTWEKIHENIEKTIPIDLNKLKLRTKPIRYLSKKLKTIINDMCDKEGPKYVDDTFHDAMQKTLFELKRNVDVSSQKERLIKLSLVFVFFFVCIGMELDNSPINNYWEKRKISDPFERFYWLIENLPEIVIRGPIIEMAKMAEMQFIGINTTSRGLLHDCLHSVYCYYTDNLLSDDDHFNTLKKNVDHKAFQGIIMAKDFGNMWVKVISELKTHG